MRRFLEGFALGIVIGAVLAWLYERYYLWAEPEVVSTGPAPVKLSPDLIKPDTAAPDDFAALRGVGAAFAERLHQHVRSELWGYAPQEQLTNEALIKEKYRGIRPAPGYPACPDHSLKPMLFDLLDAEANTGITLTENFAMYPTAAVSGFYFAHPEAQYFGVARIGRDQLEDYAQRRGVDMATAERWLRPNLD